MNIEKWIPNYILYTAIGINYVLALFGAYIASMEIMILSIISIASCGVSLWARAKQKNDKS